MSTQNRRNFLKAATGFTAASYSRIFGANGRVNVAFIGTGKMGWGNMHGCKAQFNTRITHLCDVWYAHLRVAMGEAPNAKTTNDFLQVLDDHKATDAVCISTPDHWHALIAVMAMERGLHVYCEKPAAHSVEEMKAMVRAARKYNRVTQTGQWQHADTAYQEAIERAQSGELGELSRVYTTLYWQEPNIGSPENSPPPKELGEWGWDRWCGPAPFRPFNWTVFQSDPASDPKHEQYGRWRYFLDNGLGMAGDWGPHMITPGTYGMQCKGPYRVASRGERGCVTDMREAPAVWYIEADFKDPKSDRTIPVIFDHNGCKPAPPGKRRQVDTVFEYASGARIRVNRESFELIDEKGTVARRVKHDSGRALNEHWRDFITHIREDDMHTRTRFEKVCQSHMMMLVGVALYRAANDLDNPYTEVVINRPVTDPDNSYASPEILWDPEKNKMIGPKRSVQRYLEYHYRKPWKMPKI